MRAPVGPVVAAILSAVVLVVATRGDASAPPAASPASDVASAEAAAGAAAPAGEETTAALAQAGLPRRDPTPAAQAASSSQDAPGEAALPPVPASRDRLARALQALVTDPEFDTRAAIGIVVRDEHGRTVLERNPGAALMPASTLKIVTAAASLQLFGTGGRLSTDVLATGPVTGDGVVVGDLVLRAGGDPTLATEPYRRFVYPARPSSDLEDLADAVAAAGVTRVLGNLVVDDEAYGDDRLPEGWKDRYLSDFDGRYISGLTVDASLDVVFVPPFGATAGDLLTADLLDDDRLSLHLATDPSFEAGRDLAGLLADRGIALHGTVAHGATPETAAVVASLPSPRMREILQHTVKRSDNHAADTLFRVVGAEVTGRSTWESSAQAVELVLADLGVDFAGAVLHDGSGLSRDDRVTAAMLADLDVAMNAGPYGPAWRGLMSVAGVDGTLEKRLVGTLAEGRFRAKTGTLNDVRAIAGSVIGPAGTRYHLAVLANGGEVWRANALIDRIALELAIDLWCHRPVDDPPDDVVNACVGR